MTATDMECVEERQVNWQESYEGVVEIEKHLRVTIAHLESTIERKDRMIAALELVVRCMDKAGEEAIERDREQAQIIEARDGRIDELEAMLRKKLDIIKCGISANYSGDPYENKIFLEAWELLNKQGT